MIYGRGYPNPVEIGRSAFIRQIIRFMPDDIKIRVVAPVPFFLNRRQGKATLRIPVRRQELIGEKRITICHPRFILLPRNLLRPVVAYLQFISTILTVKRLHIEEPIDLIHCNWVFPDGVAGGLIARCLSIPYIITEHQSGIGIHLQVPFIKQQIIQAYGRASRVILVSHSLTRPLAAVIAALGDYSVIPNGVDVQSFPLRSELRPLKKLLYIGNLIPDKGLQFLIPALARLIHEGYDLDLDIVGKGPSTAVLKALAKALGIRDRVCFRGAKAPDEIQRLLLNYDLLILPSLQESFGMVLIEALATGMPVLATRSGGPASIVTPDVGELVEPGSADALCEGIKQLISRWEGFQAGQIRVYCAQNFQISSLCQKIAEVYHEVTGV